jgi:hypothetical protein
VHSTLIAVPAAYTHAVCAVVQQYSSKNTLVHAQLSLVPFKQATISTITAHSIPIVLQHTSHTTRCEHTGGILLNDWRTGDAGKLQLMSRLQPSPSVFTAPITAKQVCGDYGGFPPGVNCSGTAAAPADRGITVAGGSSSSDPYCANGIKRSSSTQKLCCSKECVDRQGKSTCGTKECSANGMAKKCCYSAVSKSDKPCSSNTASCAPYLTRKYCKQSNFYHASRDIAVILVKCCLWQHCVNR